MPTTTTDAPYRAAPATPARADAPPAAATRPLRAGRVLATGAALAMGVGVAITSHAWMIGAIALFYGYSASEMFATRRRRRAVERLAALPFRLTHDRTDPRDAGPRGRAIARVTVRLARAPERAALDAAARAAVAIAPGLAATVDGDTIVLERWPWRSDDVLLLDEILRRWGTAIHAEIGVAEIAVAWARGGPPLSR